MNIKSNSSRQIGSQTRILNFFNQICQQNITVTVLKFLPFSDFVFDYPYTILNILGSAFVHRHRIRPHFHRTQPHPNRHRHRNPKLLRGWNSHRLALRKTVKGSKKRIRIDGWIVQLFGKCQVY